MSGADGFSAACSWLIRSATMRASPVLPEPGIPLTAIRRRVSAGLLRSFAGGLLC